jgi:hypothetical protein
MKKFMIIVALTLVFQTVPTNAQPWEQLGKTEDGVIMGIDAGSIKAKPPTKYTREFPVVQVWVEFYNSTMRQDGVQYSRQLISIDCEGERSASLSIIAYASGGRVIDSNSERDADYRYEPIPPGTLIEQ